MIQQTSTKNLTRQRTPYGGSALIAIIASILLFSVLSATLLPMVSSSGTQVAFTSLTDRAYTLAESGYRLMENRYYDAGSEALGYAELDALEDANFTLDDNQGTIHLNIYSYFFRITAIDAPNQFTADPPGAAAPDINIISYSGPVQIGNQQYTIDSATVNGGGGNFTFTVSESLDPQIATDDIVYPATQTVTDGTLNFSNGFAQSLTYTANEGEWFPVHNGTIKLGSHILKYRHNDRANHQFIDLNDPYAPGNGTFSYTYPAGEKIVLTNFTMVHSTAKVGGGSFMAEREVIYYDALPLSVSSRPRPGFEDNFNIPGQSWGPEDSLGTIDPESNGNPAVTITPDEDSTSGLATLNTDETQEAFDSLLNITGNYLGYDAQIKVGFSQSSAEHPIPFSVAAGLSFRLSEVAEGSTTEYNGYGLSFVRGDSSDGVGSGLLPEIIPAGQDDRSLIVLWQQTVDGSDVERDWLAYKILSSFENPIYETDFDQDAQGWEIISPNDSSINQWTWMDSSVFWGWIGSPLFPKFIIFGSTGESGSNEWHGGFQYPEDDGNDTNTDDWIYLCDEADANITVSFQNNSLNSGTGDTRDLIITVKDEGPLPAFPITSSGQYSRDLSEFELAGKLIRIQFYFSRDENTSDSDPYYWIIDNLSITCQEPQWPAQNSTLLVRLQEAAVVEFTDGGTPSSTVPLAIETGDWIFGEETQTRATVVGTPILSGGNWTTDDATGTLLLNDILDGSGGPGFNVGETLHVMNRTGGIQVRVSAYNDSNDRKVNVIKAYFGSENGSGTPNDDPLDGNMTAYERLEADETLRWPPDEGEPWTEEADYFRLIQWDAVNDANTSALDVGTIASVETPNAILRTHEEKLQSPAAGAPSPSPEFGLHVYGDGASRTYFDDFGFQLIFPPANFFAAPFQQ